MQKRKGKKVKHCKEKERLIYTQMGKIMALGSSGVPTGTGTAN
jgi:hypothetical protein